jgi:hypothetical protein
VTRQCTNCAAFLPPERRSPLCAVCWPVWQLSRNREKVRAFRARTYAARAAYMLSAEDYTPHAEDYNWLDSLDLGLAEPICEVQNLIESGTPISDPDVARRLREILTQYDQRAADLEAASHSWEDPEGSAVVWRGYFQSVRRALG